MNKETVSNESQQKDFAEKVLNNFLKLFKQECLLISEYYFAKAKFPNSDNLPQIHSLALFYDYMGQTFKKAAKEADYVFSFNVTYTNSLSKALKQLFLSTINKEKTFGLRQLVCALDAYIISLSNTLSHKNTTLKNWELDLKKSTTDDISEKIKERQTLLESLPKSFSSDILTSKFKEHYLHMDLVLSRFTGGTFKALTNVTTVINSSTTNDSISVFEVNFKPKVSLTSKIISAKEDTETALNVVFESYFLNLLERPYVMPEKYKSLYTSKNKIKDSSYFFNTFGKLSLLKINTNLFFNSVITNLSFGFSGKLVPALSKFSSSAQNILYNEVNLLQNIQELDKRRGPTEFSNYNFISIVSFQDYLSESSINSALLLTDYKVKKEEVEKVYKEKESFRTKLLDFLGNYKKDLIYLLELQHLEDTVSKKVESVSGFCKKQIDLLEAKNRKDQNTKDENVAKILNRSEFCDSIRTIKDSFFNSSSLQLTTEVGVPVGVKLINKPNELLKESDFVLKEDNNLSFNLDKVIQRLLLGGIDEYAETANNEIFHKHKIFVNIFKTLAIAAGYTYDIIKDQNLDHFAVIEKRRSEHELATVFALLFAKFYDNNTSEDELFTVLQKIKNLIISSGNEKEHVFTESIGSEQAVPPTISTDPFVYNPNMNETHSTPGMSAELRWVDLSRNNAFDNTVRDTPVPPPTTIREGEINGYSSHFLNTLSSNFFDASSRVNIETDHVINTVGTAGIDPVSTTPYEE